jgi:hypothetical protein
MRPAITVLFLAFSLVFSQSRGNGDRIDSFPNLLERQLLVLTNACRMAPAEYRDLYIGAYQVLLPANYPAVKPLYWNLRLNRSAHAHAIDMANNCGLQHPSCDGTAWNTRIKSYYTKSQTIAENIASGNTTALATVKQWVLEVDPSSTPVPADLSSSDGHRKNIMDSAYRELGTGYARGPKQYTYFWVHDFGGGAPDFTSPLVVGCHFFIETGKTTFFVNYSDPATAPSGVSCVIENQPYPMSRALGTDMRGTWTLVQTRGTACRAYYFTCMRSGANFRYPEYGMLVTSGEGSCVKDYIPPESLSVKNAAQGPAWRSLACSYHFPGNLRLINLPDRWASATISVIDLQGRERRRFRLSGTDFQSQKNVLLRLPRDFGSGLLLIRAEYDGIEQWTGTIAVRP